jgi:pectate lyase
MPAVEQSFLSVLGLFAGSLGLLACSSAPAAPPVPDGGGTVVDTRNCGEPAAPFYGDSPVGWASMPDLGLEGTTGGNGGEVVDVSTTEEFIAANARTEPLVIQVHGTIGDSRRVKVGSNKTILGVEDRPTLQGSLEIEEVQNVIVRNLYVVGNNCADAEGGDCQRGSDALGISDGAHHIWIDHVDVSDGSDGNLDVNHAADYVTISWSKFSYSGTTRDHRFSNLIGSSDSNTTDRGHLRVTWDHCWWAERVQERMPRSRFGDVHVLNSYFSSARDSYCVRAGIETRILVEGSYFDHVESPFDIENATGVIESRNNTFDSSMVDVGTGAAFAPPYAYTPEPTESVPCAVSQGAGPH